MRPLLRERGHELFTPSYTGLGERSHLATPDVGLETHIQDILNVLFYEDLSDVILIGHSYGGMVATGVADRAPERLRHLVYLDAFVPRDGQALFDLLPPDARARMQAGAQTEGEGWRIPPIPPPPDTSEADLAWTRPRRVMHPLKAFEQPARLTGAIDRVPRTYVYALRAGPGDTFRQFAERAKSEAGWGYEELDVTHNPHITAPDLLVDLLERVARA
jgi:pimeloyl-ACP methyl ester carboxylesterase